MKRLLFILSILIINTGLLQAEQETPVVSKALRDTLQERLKLVRRYSTNTRTTDFTLARRHMQRVLQLSDSLHLEDADYLAAAGDLEDLAFNYERNKPALGKKTDEAECLASAKKCYLYYDKAYDLYGADEKRYGKAGQKQQQRIRQTAMRYYLLTNGFQVNAGQSFKKGDLETTLGEFKMTYEGSTCGMLREVYRLDPKRNSGFEAFMADSTQCKALYNCATVASALGRLDESLKYYDSLKVRGYEPAKVFRNTAAIYASRRDTVMLMTELMAAQERVPQDTWFPKNLLQLYLVRQQWKEAEQTADRCLKVDSLDAPTLCVRGQLYEMQGDTEKAMVEYLKSYDEDSTQAKVCSYIGRVYYNKAVRTKKELYDERRFKEIDEKMQPFYEQALPWYQRAYVNDELREDKSIPMALREILYSRFTQAKCPNRQELITEYNEVSRAYGLSEFGK